MPPTKLSPFLNNAILTGTLLLAKSKLVITFDGSNFYTAPFQRKADSFVPIVRKNGILSNPVFDQNPIHEDEHTLISDWLAGYTNPEAKRVQELFAKAFTNKDFYQIVRGEYEGRKYAAIEDLAGKRLATYYDCAYFNYEEKALKFWNELRA